MFTLSRRFVAVKAEANSTKLGMQQLQHFIHKILEPSSMWNRRLNAVPFEIFRRGKLITLTGVID